MTEGLVMQDTDAAPAFAETAEAVIARLSVPFPNGLSAEEAATRLARHGPNALRRPKPRSALRILLHQFQGVIVALLVLATVFSLVINDIVEALAILVVLLLNGAIGFFTELRATRSMEALFSVAEVRTRVRRDGMLIEVDARDLVPGDLVVLEAGDVVTADLRLVEASGLHCDESVLTGESLPVLKTTKPLPSDAVLGDRTNMGFKGAAVTRGAGTGVVVRTGMETEIGKISQLAMAASTEPTPLEHQLTRLGQRLVWLTIVLAVAIIITGLAQGHPLTSMIQTGVALAVAAIPEGIPVVATLSLARGMWRMVQRNALISRLSSVETLGATTLILTDKTGTLTENRMSVVQVLLDGGSVDLDGPETGLAEDRLRAALKIGMLCNNAELGDGDEGRIGDPTELALLSAARQAGVTEDEAEPRLLQHAFESDSLMMATVHALPDGGALYAVKGAPEAVIASCSEVLGAEGPRPLSAEAKADWIARNADAASEGLRGIGLAMKRTDGTEDAPYEGLTLVAIACLADPLRKDVPPAIAACQSAGVRVIMLTGDHAETAARIAKDAGISGNGAVAIEGRDLTGLDLENAPEETLDRLRKASVFARVAPATKLDLVSFYQREGETVAMTGDGVNDAPALKKADIGIAMGQRGTQVAREAAHMVLKDDDFATIVEAVRQGRVIFGNIRKFIVYLMSCNLSEILVVGIAVGVGLPSPLLPLQILFLNLVTDVFPALALGLGHGDGHEMRRPPRDRAEPILARREWGRIIALGVIVTLATMLAFGGALYGLQLAPAAAVTVAFVTLALGQLWNVFNMREADTHALRNDVTRNPYVWGALVLCLVLIAGALWLPGLSDVLQLPSPGIAGLTLAGAMSLLPPLLGHLVVSRATRR
ncbi:MAG: ATPase [Thioclava sp.]|nr:ATPase [Thioclava sp.]